MTMVNTSLERESDREFKFLICNRNLKSLQCFIDRFIDLLGNGGRLGF